MATKKPRQKPKRIFKKRPCRLCKEKIKTVDYKNADFLKRFISDRGKILPSRISGNCTRHQRLIANRVKRARIAGILPFVQERSARSRGEFSRSNRSDREYSR